MARSIMEICPLGMDARRRADGGQNIRINLPSQANTPDACTGSGADISFRLLLLDILFLATP